MATYGNCRHIYSVPIMFAFINMEWPEKISIEVPVKKMQQKCWGDPSKGIRFSPLEVINDPAEYQKDYARIRNANLNYPIIIDSKGHIVDGMHRVSRAFLDKIDVMDAYQFSDELMEKFIIADHNEWEKAHSMDVIDYVHIYVERFCGTSFDLESLPGQLKAQYDELMKKDEDNIHEIIELCVNHLYSI